MNNKSITASLEQEPEQQHLQHAPTKSLSLQTSPSSITVWTTKHFFFGKSSIFCLVLSQLDPRRRNKHEIRRGKRGEWRNEGIQWRLGRGRKGLIQWKDGRGGIGYGWGENEWFGSLLFPQFSFHVHNNVDHAWKKEINEKYGGQKSREGRSYVIKGSDIERERGGG